MIIEYARMHLGLVCDDNGLRNPAGLLVKADMIKAIFGKVKFNKHLCPICGNSLLNNKKTFKCDVCEYEASDGILEGIKVIVPPPGIRKKPSAKIQRELVEAQNNKCYWCNRRFGRYYWRKNKVHILKTHFDHAISFNFEQTNRVENWRASCDVCNLFKHDFIFRDEEDCKKYLKNRWKEALDYNVIELIDGGFYED